MPPRQTRLPDRWIVSDARNDARLDAALAKADEPVGLIYRHYHLPPDERRARFDVLARIARSRGHVTVVSDSARQARLWGAHGVYGPPGRLRPRAAGLLHLATAHDLGEIALANLLLADAVLLSPVFETRSHPGGPTLGPVRFRLLARHATCPVIALGGMTAARARQLGWQRWAAIDGVP